MTTPGWAERAVEKAFKEWTKGPNTDGWLTSMPPLLKAEHARDVRIVKRMRTTYCPEHPVSQYQHGYAAALADVLAALERGRG